MSSKGVLPLMTDMLAANALALVHLTFILFVVFGGLLVLRWPRLIWAHMPAAVWGAMIEFGGWYCPLTTWENTFLRRAGQAGYSGGFVEHYLFAILYPDGLTRAMQIGLGLFVLAVNVVVYTRFFSARNGRRSGWSAAARRS